MFHQHKLPGSLILGVAWLSFSTYLWITYATGSHLQTMTAADLTKNPPSHGWIQVGDGLLDNSDAVGWIDYGSRSANYISYVPYLNPATRKPILLVAYVGSKCSPDVLREAGSSNAPSPIQGTIVPDTADSREAQLLAQEGLQMPAAFPIMSLSGPLDLPTALTMTCFSGLLILLLVGGIHRPGSH